ncbi:MAG: hypothetical protein M3388_08120 [Acidobacteriota bacterium]|nr:hypothetical protein [Acidobacteriota bacterium]
MAARASEIKLLISHADAQQVNGRKGEATALLKRRSLNSDLCVVGFAQLGSAV